MEKYNWGFVKNYWDNAAGEAARQHTLESNHNDHFMLTQGVTVTCVHPQCDPQWQWRKYGNE